MEVENMKRQRCLKALAIVLPVLLAWTQNAVLSQQTAQINHQLVYQQRELQAPPAIKARLAQLRTEMKTKNLKFNIGYTVALDRSLEQLTGLVMPHNLGTQAINHSKVARQLDGIDNAARDDYARQKNARLYEMRFVSAANAASFDWRKQGKVTPVRDQGACGSCWAFAALGAYEGSYLIRNGVAADASEQDVLDCSKAGSCKGGWHTNVFDYLMGAGDASESGYGSYKATQGTCSATNAEPLHAVTWDYVTHDTIPGTTNQRMPTVKELKESLTTYGPLAVTVLVTPLFELYTGGEAPFDEPKTEGEEYVTPPDKTYPTGQKFKVDAQGRAYALDASGGKYYAINHVVTLIGWDDAKKAWLIKNSWGTLWGGTADYGDERGYMWIAYNTNNIGYAAAWVKAKSNFYQLPIGYHETLNSYLSTKQLTMPVQPRIQVPPAAPPKKPVNPQVKPTSH
jgi:cathepsin L